MPCNIRTRTRVEVTVKLTGSCTYFGYSAQRLKGKVEFEIHMQKEWLLNLQTVFNTLFLLK